MKYIKLVASVTLFSLLLSSCSDFLEVENYEGIPADEFITSVNNAQTAVNGVYSGLYGEYLYYYGIYYYTCFASQELEFRATLGDVKPLVNYAYSDQATAINTYWKNLYSIVSRANDVSTKIYDLINSGKLTVSENQELMQMIGECKFLRGFSYFLLTRSFGDKLPSHPAYNSNELGVPILDTLIVSREQLMVPRNTLGECWSVILRDFETAYNLLPTSWSTDKLGAVTKGAAAGYLGQVYMYLKDYESAKTWFEKSVQCGNQRGGDYQLVENYAWNFDFLHENNSESIFEVQFQTISDDTRLASYLWRRLGPDGVGGGFGIVNVAMDWVNKFNIGYELTQEVYDEYANLPSTGEINIITREVMKAYQVAIGVQVFSEEEFFKLYTGDWDALGDAVNQVLRANHYRLDVKTEPGWGTADNRYIQTILNASRSADPRMYDSFYVPGRDSVALDWAATKVIDYPNSYYGFKKYIPYNAVENWASEGLPGFQGSNSINQRIFRLADLYLQYAEACYRTGDNTNAEKYLNKVRRRAWKLPFDDASLQVKESVDYPSDDDTGDFIDAIIAEREKELCLEGHLWFDYLRWNKAEELFKTKGFEPNKHHRLPIPLAERQIVGMDVLLQNSGY